MDESYPTMKRVGAHGRPRVNLLGRRFGSLLVIADAGTQSGIASWLCRCDCGKELEVRRGNLRIQQSCGCIALADKTKHGHARKHHESPEYVSWQGMKDRCLNSHNKKHVDYGARGITVCERWMGFHAFLEDMGTKPSPEHTIDRIDNDGNYEPGNCRWATKARQARNQRRAKLTDESAAEIRRRRLAGEPLKALSAEFGVTMAMVCAIAKGRAWRPEESRTSDSE